MRKWVGHSAFLSLLFCTVNAAALPKITTENINGFQVDFVDIGRGDTFAATFTVPIGTMHEWGPMMGRAHLLEHLLHVGTLAMPGYHTFTDTVRPAGVDTNASTGSARTFYYATGHANSTELMIKAELGMLGGLEWNPETIEKERSRVINEVVEEYLPKERDALSQMPIVKLLPRSNPLNHPSIGDLKSLQALTINDLKELYYQNYGPGSARVALIGNFSDPQYFAQVREWTQKYLHAPDWRKDKQPYQPKSVPLKNVRFVSMFSSNTLAPESEARLFIETKQNRWSGIFLEAPDAYFPRNAEAVDYLTEFLSMDAPGTLIYKLKTELGWISNGGVSHYRINNRHYMRFQVRLTNAGAGHEVDINTMFFNALSSLESRPLSAELLEMMKSRTLQMIEQNTRSVADVAQLYGQILGTHPSLAHAVAETKAVSISDVQRVARAFRPDQALYYYSGPGYKDMLEDEQGYQRRYMLEDNRAALERYLNVYQEGATQSFAPILEKVDLGVVDSIVQPKNENLIESGMHTATHLSNDFQDAAIGVDFDFIPQSGAELVAADLMQIAFREHYSAHDNYLSLLYSVSSGSGLQFNRLGYSAHGDDSRAARALAWQLEQLASFHPSNEELERAKQKYVSQRAGQFDAQFAAMTVIDYAKENLDRYFNTPLNALKFAQSMTPEEILKNWNSLRAKADLRITAAGRVHEEDVAKVKAAARKMVPVALTEQDRQENQSRYWWKVDQEVRQSQALPVPRPGDPHGLLRAYRGPSTANLHDGMAFLALGSLVHNLVAKYNGGEQKLGYIHQASAHYLGDKYWTLWLLGGTEGVKNAELVVSGWEHVLNLIRNGQVSDDEFRDSILDILNTRSQARTSAADQLGRMKAGLNFAENPEIYKQELEVLKKLTPQDVRDVAQKYILAAKTPFYQLTMSNCEQALTNASNKVTVD